MDPSFLNSVGISLFNVPMSKLTIPLSLYIHIPWCVKKCPYCDFNSHQLRNEIPEELFVKQLLLDLKNDLHLAQNRTLKTIFFGGGTPSLLSPTAINAILAGVEKMIPFESGIEITLEANPGTIEEKRFVGFKAAGVNRLSIGVQSFNQKHLKKLGRIHDEHEAESAILAAKKAGFTNFNIDIMHGLPQQTPEEAFEDLTHAIHLEPTHLSWYQLTLEPNTLFYVQKPTLPKESILNHIFEEGEKIITAHGFLQYEVSAFSKPNLASRHNLNYWEFGDYLGIGPGAHSKITDLNTGEILRLSKHRHPKDYLQKTDFVTTKDAVSAPNQAFEFLLNALRLKEGFHPELFQRTQERLESLWPKLKSFEADGLLELQPRIKATTKGFRYLNDLLESFLPEA